MLNSTFYVLKNKENGKYVYEDIQFMIYDDTKYSLKETDNIRELTIGRGRCGYNGIEHMKNRKNYMEEKYNLNLDIVEIKEYITYEEINL